MLPVSCYPEHFTEKYRDSILKLPSRLSTHIIEGRLKISATYLKLEKLYTFSLLSRIFVHSGTFTVIVLRANKVVLVSRVVGDLYDLGCTKTRFFSKSWNQNGFALVMTLP